LSQSQDASAMHHSVSLPGDRPLAIVIGVSNYARPAWKLRTAATDAEALAERLERDHGYDVTLVLDERATRAELRRLFGELPGRMADRRRLLVYFAGHGVAKDSVGDIAGYLVPHDGGDDVHSLFAMDELADALRAVAPHHLLVILDCCFAGAFHWAATRDIVQAPVMYKERFELYLASPCWQVLTSAAHNQLAAEVLAGQPLGERDAAPDAVPEVAPDAAPDAERSPFLAALIDGLSGSADLAPRRADGTSGDGIITASELYLYTRDKVEPASDRAGQLQTPNLWRVRPGDLGEYLFFNPGKPPVLVDAPALTEATCPYRGAEPYEERDGELLFGCDEAIRALRDHTVGQPISIVVGASGAGKSSLVMAGLLPALRRTAPDLAILGRMRPGPHPLTALDAALSGRPPGACCLVVDPLEEVVTLATDVRERESFLERLARLPGEGVRIIATLRSDFEAILQHGPLKAGWAAARFPVPELTQDELRKIVVRPAEARVLVFDPPELVDRLVNSVLGAPGALALLSFTLRHLYAEMVKRATGDRKLRGADYESVTPDGQIRGVLGEQQRSAGALAEELDAASRATLHAVLLRLLTPQGGAPARRRVPLRELEFADPDENRRTRAVLERLSAPALRMVVIGADASGAYTELAHDAVVRCWPEVQRTLADPRALDELLLQRSVTRAAFEWRDALPRRGLLWDNHARLGEAIAARDRAPARMNRVETEFLERSRTARNVRRGAVAVMVVAIATAGAVAYARTQTAREATRNAEDSGLAASGAQVALRAATPGQERAALIDGIRSLRKAIATGRPIAPSVTSGATIATARYHHVALPPRAQPVLTIACSHDGARVVASAGSAAVLARGDGAVERELPAQSGDLIMAAAVTPDGTAVVTASDAGHLVIWNAGTGSRRTETTVQGATARAVAITPDGRTVGLAAEDGRVALWRASETPTVLDKLAGGAFDVTFSPDGGRLAAGGRDGVARIWTVAGGVEVFATPPGGDGPATSFIMRSVRFSPDGTHLLTAGGIVRVWDIASRALLGQLRAGDGISLGDTLRSGGFSSDGAEILTLGADQVVRRWNARSYGLIDTVFVSPSFVTAVAPCGPSRVAVSDDTGHAVVLDLSYDNARVTAGSGDRRDLRILSLTPAPDGGWYAAIEAERAVVGRIEHWDLRGSHRTLVFEVAAGPWTVAPLPGGTGFAVATHTELVTFDAAGQVRRRIALAAIPLTSLPPAFHPLVVGRASLSRDGRWLTAPTMRGVDGDGPVYANRVWNVATGELAAELPGGNFGIFFGAGAFGPENNNVAVVTQTKTGGYQAQIFDRTSHAQIAAFGESIEPLLSIALSPAGDRAATTGSYGTVTIWDVATKKPLAQLFGHAGAVWSATFSPDGLEIATAGDDGTARLWDAATGAQLARYTGHTASVWAVQFSADGSQLITGGLDGATRVYPTQPGDILAQACDRIAGDLDPAGVCR
jgi:WD40 repeat protein